MTAFSTPEEGWNVWSQVKAAAATAGAPPYLAEIVSWLDPKIANPGLDFGLTPVIRQIQALATAGVITSAEVTTLLALAQVPATLTHADITRIYAPRRGGSN
jgi:hypothetical protein